MSKKQETSNSNTNLGKRLAHITLLEQCIKDFAEMVRAHALEQVTPELSAAALDRIVDIDYNLRKVALAHGVTGLSRKEYAERKGQIIKIRGDSDTRLRCALCKITTKLDCSKCELSGPVDYQPVYTTTTQGVKPCLSRGST